MVTVEQREDGANWRLKHVFGAESEEEARLRAADYARGYDRLGLARRLTIMEWPSRRVVRVVDVIGQPWLIQARRKAERRAARRRPA